MTINSIKNWFEQAVPNPTDKNRAVQIGCHFEEVGEMMDASCNHQFSIASEETKLLAATLKENWPGVSHADVDRAALLDALCDQIVTAIGVGHMFGLDVEAALAEVNRSNWSKFVEGKPVFDVNGKIAKPATYSPPNLTPFV
ncbi:hypothetical protein [Acidovorax phage ACPWH]|nr:hypothetical protein [Acidovorax phage ACPWH]